MSIKYVNPVLNNPFRLLKEEYSFLSNYYKYVNANTTPKAQKSKKKKEQVEEKQEFEFYTIEQDVLSGLSGKTREVELADNIVEDLGNTCYASGLAKGNKIFLATKNGTFILKPYENTADKKLYRKENISPYPIVFKGRVFIDQNTNSGMVKQYCFEIYVDGTVQSLIIDLLADNTEVLRNNKHFFYPMPQIETIFQALTQVIDYEKRKVDFYNQLMLENNNLSYIQKDLPHLYKFTKPGWYDFNNGISDKEDWRFVTPIDPSFIQRLGGVDPSKYHIKLDEKGQGFGVGNRDLFYKTYAEIFAHFPMMSLLGGYVVSGFFRKIVKTQESSMIILHGTPGCGKTKAWEIISGLFSNIGINSDSNPSCVYRFSDSQASLFMSLRKCNNTFIAIDEPQQSADKMKAGFIQNILTSSGNNVTSGGGTKQAMSREAILAVGLSANQSGQKMIANDRSLSNNGDFKDAVASRSFDINCSKLNNPSAGSIGIWDTDFLEPDGVRNTSKEARTKEYLKYITNIFNKNYGFHFKEVIDFIQKKHKLLKKIFDLADNYYANKYTDAKYPNKLYITRKNAEFGMFVVGSYILLKTFPREYLSLAEKKAIFKRNIAQYEFLVVNQNSETYQTIEDIEKDKFNEIDKIYENITNLISKKQDKFMTYGFKFFANKENGVSLKEFEEQQKKYAISTNMQKKEIWGEINQNTIMNHSRDFDCTITIFDSASEDILKNENIDLKNFISKIRNLQDNNVNISSYGYRVSVYVESDNRAKLKTCKPNDETKKLVAQVQMPIFANRNVKEKWAGYKIVISRLTDAEIRELNKEENSNVEIHNFESSIIKLEHKKQDSVEDYEKQKFLKNMMDDIVDGVEFEGEKK